MTSARLLLLAAAMTLHAAAPAAENDLLIVNAKVWTVDPARTTAEAVAVRDGRIAVVGNRRDAEAAARRGCRVIDAGGKLLLPGFIDNHAHFMDGGFQMQGVDLRQAKSPQEFAAIVRAHAAKHPGRWVTGGTWDHDSWPGSPLPTKELVDPFTAETPVFVSRYDGHMALANSMVLRMAGVTRDTPDPPGGAIVRDPATGEPTGVLKDEAMSLVYRHIPAASDDERMEAVRLALAEARRNGVTTVQDISSDRDVALYRALRRKGELTARLYCILPVGLTDTYLRQGMKTGHGDAWVRTGALKAFADGSLGSSTALFFEPYLNEPGTRGLPMDILTDGRLERWARDADRGGMQLAIHAIGDSAISLILDLYERIAAENPRRDRRFRIEHAQHVHPKDFDRFARLGVIAVAQPFHAIDDGRWAEGRIGKERCRTTYPFRTFLDRKVRLCFGSDWTVAPLNPLLGIYAAVTRRTTDGAHPGGWYPEQRIGVAEAIEASTIGSAYACFEEKERGSITPGKLADLVLLSDDILTIDPVRIEQTRVLLTVVDGRVVFEQE